MEKIKKILIALVVVTFAFQNAGFCVLEINSALRPPSHFSKATEAEIRSEHSRLIYLEKSDGLESSPFVQIVRRVFRDRGYEVGKYLNSGQRGLVFKAKEIMTSRYVAIKIADPFSDIDIKKCFNYCKQMADEIKFYKGERIFNRNIPGLVQLYKAGFIAAGDLKKYAPSSELYLLERLGWDYPYQIMEYIEDENAEELLANNFFYGKDVVDNLVEFLYDIDNMHRLGLAHGELFPRNVIVASGSLKFKACDLDCLTREHAVVKEDVIELYNVVTQILTQTNPGFASGFFNRWTIDTVLEKGMRVFADAIKSESGFRNPYSIYIIDLPVSTRNAI